MRLTERFSNGKMYKNVRTVAELIEELKLMPGDIPVKVGFSPSADVVLFNCNGSDTHVTLEYGGMWDEDADVESQDL